MTTRTYVSDLVGEEYKSWDNESIILDCGTGTGKTKFILSVLAKYAYVHNKNMLYLCNRKKLREQIQYDVGHLGFSNVEIESYQQLQKKIEDQESIKHYDYIIADEAHYFISDALFNIYTDLSYNFLIHAENCVVVYMSATAKDLYNILESKGKVKKNRHYTIQTDYSYVDKLYFFKKKELINILDTLLEKTNDKIIYFCNSKEKFINAYNHFKEKDIANFICSEYTKDPSMSKINQPDCIKHISNNYITFEKRILIATKALDNGVDLKDTEIKHIVTDIFDLDSAVQCLGRKRIQNVNDTCNFYIRDYEKKALLLFQQHIKEDLEPVQLFIKNPDEFIMKYGKRSFHNNTIYTDWKGDKLPKVNEIRYIKLLLDNENIKLMYKLSYKNMILKYLGNSITKSISEMSFIDKCEKSNLELFLESHINIKLFNKGKKHLIELCNIRDDHKRQLKSIKVINSYLEECNLPYIVVKGRETTKEKRTYWLIRLDTKVE